jgi:DNA-binding SARP family transcriptional activator
LRQLLDAAVGGSGGLVLIGGEAGIGKTALATSIECEAHGRGIPVWVGHCYELAATPPYGPWVDSGIFDQRCEDVLPPPMLGVGEESGAASSQAALFEQMHEFLAAVVRQNPLVLILEDLHWSDPASLELLRFVSRNLDELRALLVVTYRDDEVTRRSPLYRLLPTLVRESRARRIELRRLGERAIQELVAASYTLPAPDERRLVSYLADLAEGNAFFTIELLRTLEEELVLHREGEGWALEDPGGIRVPSLLRQVIEGRLERLGEETRRLLAVAAVIGQEVPFGLWQSVSDTSDDRLAETIGRALEAHLVEEAPGGEKLRFVHALVRETLYRDLVLPFRRGWHRQVGEALEETARPNSDEVAHHFRQAGDPRAERWLVRAGLRAEGAYAWMTAVERFEAALDFLEGNEGDARKKGWLLFRIGVLLRFADTGRSISYLERAEKTANAVGDRILAVNSLFTRGFVRCMSGDMRPGLVEIEASIAAAKRVPPGDRVGPSAANTDPLLDASPANEQGLFGMGDLPQSLQDINPFTNTLVEWLAHVGRYAEAVEIGEEYVARVSASGPGDNLTFAMCNNAYFGLGVAKAALGRPEEARRWFALARQAYRTFDHRVMDSFAIANELLLVNLAYYPERVAERRRLADQELNLQRRGAGAFTGEVPPLGIGRQWLRVLEGEWGEASRLMQVERGAFDAGALTQYAVCTLGELARNRGEPEKAWRYVYEVLPLGVATEPGGNRFFSAVATQRLAAALSLDAKDFPGARAWLEAHDRWLERSGAVLWRSEGQLLWARYFCENGDEQAAREHAEEALASATEPRQPLTLLATHRFLGELATDSGHLSEAMEHTEESLTLAEACEALYERALTLVAKGRLLVARGSPGEAHAVLDEVREICGPLEAEPALGRAAELEKELRSRAPSAPASLTGRVVRVFALGPARAEKVGRILDSPDWSQKPRELLFYLLSHPEGRTKEQIGLALWPDASTDQLRSSFHDTVFRLRRALGAKEWIVFEKGRYALNRSLDHFFDVEAFEENLSESRRYGAEAPEQAIRHLQEAAGLYGGDFLEDSVDSEWATVRREELSRAYEEALLLLGRLLFARGRHAEAADAYRKAIAHDELLEEAHRGLMRCHAALGERGRALRHYEELVELLDGQLGTAPAPETRALYERLRAGEEV